MPDAAANSCPDLPASPPVADLETRAVLTYCLERCWRVKIFVNRGYLDLLARDEPAFGPDPRRVARVASRRQAKAQAA